MSDPIYFLAKSEAYGEFSNFASFGFAEDGRFWPTVEHYFQAQKFADAEHRERIRTTESPMTAKKLGQSREHPIREDWETVKEDVMLHALRQKFTDPTLRELLLGTGTRELIENAAYDRYWGCGPDGKGKNRLGQLLMALREELRSA